MSEKKKALVVDDEPLIRMMIAEFLEDAGFQVSQAADGAAGLDLYRREEPNVVILDLRMPVMDGFMFLREADVAHNPRCGVIVLTGHGGADDHEEARRLGAAKFMRKPFDHDELVNIARELAEER